MIIGIDIDDTITNSWEYWIPIYEKEFNIKIGKQSQPYYSAIKESVSLEEWFAKMKQQESCSLDIPIKKDAAMILNKLKQEGHTIIFITARGKSYENPYQITKEYLDNNFIPYDKILVNNIDKSIACKEEKIDLFIDDSIKHCKEVSACGINVLLMETNYNKNCLDYPHVKDWQQIYEYINNR